MTSRRADLVLLCVTVVWGTTFAIVHDTTKGLPPLALVALRFSIAALALLPTLLRRNVLRRDLLSRGLGLGVLLFPGFALQTLGLARTTPARAGFITGLYVVIVPILMRMLGDRVSRRTVGAVIVSVSGLAVLSWGPSLTSLEKSAFERGLPHLETGDRLVFLCAIVYAVHLIAVSRWAKDLPSMPLSAIQLGVVGVLSWICAALFEGGVPVPSSRDWWPLLYLALLCTVVAFTLMMKAQPHTTPTRASLIYSLEAVFAAIFSWIWLGEVPSASVWIGGGLMLAAVLMVESAAPQASTD